MLRLSLPELEKMRETLVWRRFFPAIRVIRGSFCSHTDDLRNTLIKAKERNTKLTSKVAIELSILLELRLVPWREHLLITGIPH